VQRKRFIVFVQVLAAVLARQNVLQTEHEITVLHFLFVRGMCRIIETHGVQKVPHARAPNRGQHSVIAFIILFFEGSMFF